ncbi:hypothetical protein GCM10011384_07790 [Psychrobacillus lasiicapitis]|nr:hypothetical protein GCM10011384_07790 [Psychrobacillus lasiicapitis]
MNGLLSRIYLFPLTINRISLGVFKYIFLSFKSKKEFDRSKVHGLKNERGNSGIGVTEKINTIP